MRRPVLLLFLGLAGALAGFALLADRALVREAATSVELAAARTTQDARAAALSVRGALAQVEQDLLAGRSHAGVWQQTLALPAEPSVPFGRTYRERPRSELVGLLLSTKATASGLPEAVVAAVSLGAPAARHEVAERLLTGQLPARAEDLPYLASVLGVEQDPRVADLMSRLRSAPDVADLPLAPEFRRTLRKGGAVEGLTRRGATSLRYEVPLRTLFDAAGVAERARVATGSGSEFGVGTVPGVEGFMLLMRPVTPPRGRLLAARGLLWLGIATCLGALMLVQRALAREARAVAREKGFVASVTHELRTPVAAIRVLGEALADGTGDPREYGALLAEESERLEGLVERVLAATRMDEAPRFTPVRPAELLESVARLMRPRAERRGVMLGVRCDEDPGEMLWDAEAVRRALLNLVDNAIKHGPANGAVQVVAELDHELVRLSVRDEGPGIARRDQRRVFGRFERGTTDAPGTGLGLYLVDQVARSHGGRVDLQSGEGQGCTFALVLPRLPPAPSKARPTEPAP
jgi:two-component system, OmpR family, phosphate regulon sensor histidine kinase PhoR